ERDHADLVAAPAPPLFGQPARRELAARPDDKANSQTACRVLRQRERAQQAPPAQVLMPRGQRGHVARGQPRRGLGRARLARPEQQELAHPIGTISRTSTDPNSAFGHRAATATAARMSGASMMKYPAITSLLSANGPSSTRCLPSRVRTFFASSTGCSGDPPFSTPSLTRP